MQQGRNDSGNNRKSYKTTLLNGGHKPRNSRRRQINVYAHFTIEITRSSRVPQVGLMREALLHMRRFFRDLLKIMMFNYQNYSPYMDDNCPGYVFIVDDGLLEK